jgi:hypothetical protein
VALRDRWQHSTRKNSLAALASKTKNDGNVQLRKIVKWLLKSFPVGGMESWSRGCLRHLQISADPSAISNAVQKFGTSKLQKLFGKSRRKKKLKRILSSKSFHAAGSPV